MHSFRTSVILAAVAGIGFGMCVDAPALKAAVTQAVRNIYLNGVDISSARSQELKNVDLVINEKGDLFIVAPHYQVNEEDTYVPLSKYAQGMNAPKHQPMRKLEPVPEKPMEPTPVQPGTRDVPLTRLNPDGTIAKAGSPLVGGAPKAALNPPPAPQEAAPAPEAVKLEPEAAP